MEKPIVRFYTKSKMPQLRWATDLHQYFVYVVNRLGGERGKQYFFQKQLQFLY